MALERLLPGQVRSPDILDCLANLSSDEVFTPPALANQMLDQLPTDVWLNPDLKWLDPACKSGVFLREIARRLMVGLTSEIPDAAKRRKHIFYNMVFGIAITELTGQMTRRSLYYSKDASGAHSVVHFDSCDGNITSTSGHHTFSSGKCVICGAPEALERGSTKENYAYQFIHQEEVFNMQFDIIIGNPPYQLDDDGYGASASPLYHLFVEKALALQPMYASFIIPARWFAGGKGLDAFRAQMINDRHIRALVDYPKLYDAFPGVKIRGGVCYFLWEKQYTGDCEFTVMVDGTVISTATRDLRAGGDVILRAALAADILEKVQFVGQPTMEVQVSARKPFGMATNFTNHSTRKSKDALKLYGNHFTAWVKPEFITKNSDWVAKYKVIVPRVGGGEGRFPDVAIGRPLLLGPNEVCTETYLVAGVFDSQNEAESLLSYLGTRLVRLLISLRKPTPDTNSSKFTFVPVTTWDKTWTDAELYRIYGISTDEADFIEQMITEVP